MRKGQHARLPFRLIWNAQVWLLVCASVLRRGHCAAQGWWVFLLYHAARLDLAGLFFTGSPSRATTPPRRDNLKNCRSIDMRLAHFRFVMGGKAT